MLTATRAKRLYGKQDPEKPMQPRTNSSGNIKEILAEVTAETTSWIKTNVLTDEYGAMRPLLEHAITSVVPASDRALLVRYGCELMEKDWQEALPGMAAFEFQNINLLVTDDFFDERDSRRMGIKPISSKWGSKAAVALGFVLKSLSNECLLIGWKSNPVWKLSEAIETIEWASKWQYYSQFLEDQLSEIPLSEVSIEQYKNLIENATATGIAGALELGCIIGGCTSDTRKKVRGFGLTLGCLLQIRDDCIDYIYNESLIHKGAFSDLFTRRRRLPILAAYWQGNQVQKKAIDAILRKRDLSKADAHMVLDMLLAPRTMNFIRSYANETAMTATTQLGLLPKSNGTHKDLSRLIDLFSDL